MIKKFSTFFGKGLEEILRSTDMRPVTELVAELYDSVLRPRSFVGDRTKAQGVDRYLHVGWSEHESISHAFEKAQRVETHVYMNSGDVCVEVQFYSPYWKKYFLVLRGGFCLKTKIVTLSSALHCGWRIEKPHRLLVRVA